MSNTAAMQYRQRIEARLKKLEEHIFTPPPTAPPQTEEKDLAEPTAPPPTAEAFVFTAPGIQPFRGLELMSTEQLVNDLDGLDNLLVHMIPTLEMRDVVVNNFSFECISSPSIF